MSNSHNCHDFETCSPPWCHVTGVETASDEGTLHFALRPAKPAAAWNAGQRSRLQLWERHGQPGRITCHLDPLQSTWTSLRPLDTAWIPWTFQTVIAVLGISCCHGMSYVCFDCFDSFEVALADDVVLHNDVVVDNDEDE